MRQPAASRSLAGGQRRIEHALESAARCAKPACRSSTSSPRAEVLVGDVERGEHGDLQRVARGTFLQRQPHLLVHVGGELRDVGRIERAADRVPLAVDVDGDDRLVCSMIDSDPSSGKPDEPLQVERLDLREHVLDARLDELAFLAQARRSRRPILPPS